MLVISDWHFHNGRCYWYGTREGVVIRNYKPQLYSTFSLWRVYISQVCATKGVWGSSSCMGWERFGDEGSQQSCWCSLFPPEATSIRNFWGFSLLLMSLRNSHKFSFQKYWELGCKCSDLLLQQWVHLFFSTVVFSRHFYTCLMAENVSPFVSLFIAMSSYEHWFVSAGDRKEKAPA